MEPCSRGETRRLYAGYACVCSAVELVTPGPPVSIANTPRASAYRAGRSDVTPGFVGAGPVGTSPAGEKGFALVETLVTIIVLSIVLAIATTTWQRVVESRGVDADATQLVADLRLAHSKASNQLVGYEVVLNEGSSTYSVGPIGAPDTRELENESVVGTTVTLTFKPNGTVEPMGAPVTFDVTSARGSLSHEIEVVTATARVQLDP